MAHYDAAPESMTNEQFLAEFEKCKRDFPYFCKKYLRITHRDIIGKQTPFYFKPAQERVAMTWARCGVTFVLKPRRLGITRVILARLFHKVHFNAGVVAVTVAHEHEAALEIFKQIREWYDGLPKMFKLGPYSLKANKADELYYEHLGSYRVASADSLKLVGGQTITYRHYTEFAKFPNPEMTIAYVEGGSSAAGRAIYETTADGLGFAYEAWKGANGWEKLFLPWTVDPGYSISEEWLLERGRRPNDVLYDEVREYASKYGLTYGQALWMGNKLMDMGFNPIDPERTLRLFHQEHPITADIAFQTARGRVFHAHYGDVVFKRGLLTREDPREYVPYVMGVDTASGSTADNADFSAFAVLDMTDPESPRDVCTFYDKVDTPAFAQYVVDTAVKYGALLAIERNSYGQDIIQRVQEAEYGFLYREVRHDRATNKLTERIGFQTFGGPRSETGSRVVIINLLREYLNGLKLRPWDKRLQFEINDFQWNDDGRAEAMSPNHDDMLFAVGMALAARDHVAHVQSQKLAKRPRTWQEIHDYEHASGKLVSEGYFEDDDVLYRMFKQPLTEGNVLRPVTEVLRNMGRR